MRATILIFILAFLSIQSQAIDLNYEKTDSITYQYFIKKDYKQLQEVGNQALKKQIDFYYLRMRLGISYYENKNYAVAKTHFLKALEFYPIDTVAKEYAYFSFLFNGETEKAEVFAKKKLPPSVLKRVKSYGMNEYKWAISFGTGFILNNNIANNQAKAITDAVNNFGVDNLQGSANFYEFRLENWVNKKWSWKAGISYFALNSTGRFARPSTTVANSVNNDYFNYQNKQIQLNANVSYTTSKKWTITGGIGLYNQNYSFLTTSINGASQYVPYTYANSDWSYLVHTMVQKTSEKNIPFIGISYANWALTGSMIQLQPGFTRIWLKNSKFYSTSMLTYINQNNTNQLVLTQKIGGQISKPLWYEGGISFGNHQNMINDNGFLTFNTADPIKLIVGVDLFYFYKNLTFNLGYKFQQREGSYSLFTSSNIYKDNSYLYSNQIINTSITWKF